VSGDAVRYWLVLAAEPVSDVVEELPEGTGRFLAGGAVGVDGF